MRDAQNSRAKGLTMMEMIISLSIIAVLFAVMLPQFKNIENSWASKQAAAEALQNGRIIIEYLNRNLTKAARITAVSDPCDTTGYIEFEGNDSITYRCEIGAGNIVEFGPVGNLNDLGGPVSQLQFTCYDVQDLDTPITTVGDIRSVNVRITLTNGGSGDQTFTTQAYLRTNASSVSALVAHWEFDEGSGTMATDSSSNGHNGTIYNGASWITGDSCVWMDGATQSALYFDGDNDYVDIDSEITDEYPELTIAMWIKYVGTVNSTCTLFASTGPWGMNPGAIHLNVQRESGGLYAVEFDIVDTIYEVVELYMAPPYLFSDRWYHVTATFNNSSQIQIYIDGVLNNGVSDLSCSPAIIGYATIGAWDDGSILERFSDAAIDDVRIYSRVLDPCEISDMAGSRAGLVGHWKFDETAGTDAFDSSGNSLDATVSGAIWEANGKIDGALDFDGNDDCVDTTAESDSSINVTLSVWFQSDDAGSVGDDYVAQRFITQQRSGGDKTRLALGINNGKIAAGWNNGSSSVGEGTTILSFGQWYHAAVTYDGSRIILYLNGTEENSFSESSMSEPSGSDVGIGCEPGGGSRYYDGLLDDVRFYRRALTGTEIQAIYNQSEYCCTVSGVGGGGEILP